jgi:hypothetical protein
VTADLAQSCAAITAWLTAAQALTATPDTDGTRNRTQPASRPPCNQAAENAVTDAWEGLRRLEASLRQAVNGHPGTRRGGSDANTAAAIAAIENLGNAVTIPAMTAAARILDRWARQIQQLPAIDQYEPWRLVRGTSCPYCQVEMLQFQARSGRVACLRGGPCLDADGRPPVGLADWSVSGEPMIAWADGYIQYGDTIPAP